MSTKKKLVRSTAAQIKFLVDYMSTNPNFAAGGFSGGPLGNKKLEEKWRNLKRQLDEYGPNKSIYQWKQTWKDLKKKARYEKASALHAVRQNFVVVPKISEVSEKILDIIGNKSSTKIGPDESPNIGQSSPELHVSSPMYVSVDEDAGALYEVLTELTSPPAPDHEYTRRPTRPCSGQQSMLSHADELAVIRKENNILLKIMNELLKERNFLLREQNSILREKNRILKRK